MSPNYPKHYPNNVTCIWKIQSPKDRHTYLFFHDFELEEGFVNRASVSHLPRPHLVLPTATTYTTQLLAIL